ncbi:GNAT family N-acetyltransferase [Arthrobacter sp. SA17]
MSSLLLRPWRPRDAANLRLLYQSSPDLGTQFNDALTDQDSAERFILSSLSFNPDASCNFAIELNGVAVGNAGISNINRTHRTAWVYYWLASEVRGQGLATRAAATLSSWAIEELGTFRLELGHRINNPASCRVALGSGFRAEGVERSKLQYGNERFDVETHSRLRTDQPPAVELLPVQLY